MVNMEFLTPWTQTLYWWSEYPSLMPTVRLQIYGAGTLCKYLKSRHWVGTLKNFWGDTNPSVVPIPLLKVCNTVTSSADRYPTENHRLIIILYNSHLVTFRKRIIFKENERLKIGVIQKNGWSMIWKRQEAKLMDIFFSWKKEQQCIYIVLLLEHGRLTEQGIGRTGPDEANKLNLYSYWILSFSGSGIFSGY